MPAIGRLDTRLELIGVQRTDDGSGGQTRTDTVEAVVWAFVRPATAGEQYRSMRNELRISHVVTIRWRPDLLEHFKKGSRARFTDRAGQIRNLRIESAFDPDGKGRWIEAQALEGGPL